MNSSFEMADIKTTPDGSFAAKLPWRQYPGLLIEGPTIQMALQLAHPLVAALDSQGLDASHIETIADRLKHALYLLDSEESFMLLSAPDAPEGKGACLRPAPLVRPHDHPRPLVLFHLDTLASFVGGIKLSMADTTQPSTLASLQDLLLICENWYSQL